MTALCKNTNTCTLNVFSRVFVNLHVKLLFFAINRIQRIDRDFCTLDFGELPHDLKSCVQPLDTMSFSLFFYLEIYQKETKFKTLTIVTFWLIWIDFPEWYEYLKGFESVTFYWIVFKQLHVCWRIIWNQNLWMIYLNHVFTKVFRRGNFALGLLTLDLI